MDEFIKEFTRKIFLKAIDYVPPKYDNIVFMNGDPKGKIVNIRVALTELIK